jgi:hypothetical protein
LFGFTGDFRGRERTEIAGESPVEPNSRSAMDFLQRLLAFFRPESETGFDAAGDPAAALRRIVARIRRRGLDSSCYRTLAKIGPDFRHEIELREESDGAIYVAHTHKHRETLIARRFLRLTADDRLEYLREFTEGGLTQLVPIPDNSGTGVDLPLILRMLWSSLERGSGSGPRGRVE